MTKEKPTKNLLEGKYQTKADKRANYLLANYLFPLLQSIERESKESKEERFGSFIKNYEMLIDSLKNIIYETEELQKNDKEVTNYEEEFAKDIYSYERPATSFELFDKLQNANLILFGDFHTLRRSQETFLNIIKKYLKILKTEEKNKDFILCLEYLPPEQKINDKNLNSAVRKELIKMTANIEEGQIGAYLNIIKFAKRNNIKIVSIDTRRKRKEKLSDVDEKIAKNIMEIYKTNKGRRLFIFIGEAHLASSHLPEKINQYSELKNLNKVFIFQNVDKIYFNALKNREIFNAPVSKLNDENFYNKIFKINDSAYSIQNVSLATKYQSLLQFLESLEITTSEKSSQSFEDFINILVDYLIENIKNLKLQIKERDIRDSLPIIYFQKDIGYNKMIKKTLNKEEFQELEKTGCFLKDDKLFIKKFRLKRISKVLGQFLFEKIYPRHFLKNIDKKLAQEIFSIFCSRLATPEKFKQPTFENKEAETIADQIFQKLFLKI